MEKKLKVDVDKFVSHLKNFVNVSESSCSCVEPSWLIYVALGLGGLSLLLVLILLLLLCRTRKQLTSLHAAVKRAKDGYEYPLPFAPLPPTAETTRTHKLRGLNSSSSDDSGVMADPGETCTDTSSRSSTLPQPPLADPARQNTYVQENPDNHGRYEQLQSERGNGVSYEKLDSDRSSRGAYEPMRSQRNSTHKYEHVEGQSKYDRLNDDTISQASSHAYELLPGMSRPGSRAGSLRMRGDVPMTIAEQSENDAV